MIKYRQQKEWIDGRGNFIAFAFFLGGISGGLYLAAAIVRVVGGQDRVVAGMVADMDAGMTCKGTQLANEWRRGEYRPLSLGNYARIAADLIQRTPADIIYHRLTATASENILLAPGWCSKKWSPLNLIAAELETRGHYFNPGNKPFMHNTQQARLARLNGFAT